MYLPYINWNFIITKTTVLFEIANNTSALTAEINIWDLRGTIQKTATPTTSIGFLNGRTQRHLAIPMALLFYSLVYCFCKVNYCGLDIVFCDVLLMIYIRGRHCGVLYFNCSGFDFYQGEWATSFIPSLW